MLATIPAPAPQVAAAPQSLSQVVDQSTMLIIGTAFGDAKEPLDDLFSSSGTLVFS